MGLGILAVSVGCSDGPLGVAAVRVTPATATLGALGETVQLTASALDRGGNPIPGLFYSWTSSDELVATVDDVGLVTAVGDGVATITARAGGESGSAQVTVSLQVGFVDIHVGSFRCCAVACDGAARWGGTRDSVSAIG